MSTWKGQSRVEGNHVAEARIGVASASTGGPQFSMPRAALPAAEIWLSLDDPDQQAP
jgi:hypothetical protein